MAKNNFRAILEVVIVSISEDLNYSIPKEVSISGTAKIPLQGHHCIIFLNCLTSNINVLFVSYILSIRIPRQSKSAPTFDQEFAHTKAIQK